MSCALSSLKSPYGNAANKHVASSDKYSVPGVEGIEVEKPDDDTQRIELKTFLDQCQSEFMYLMITPANPQPPRDSPPLPMIEDLREVEQFGMPPPQHMDRQYQMQRQNANHVQDFNVMNARQQPPQNAGPQMQQPSANFAPKQELQPQPMLRSAGDNQQAMYGTPSDWSAPVSVTTRPVEENLPGPNHAAEALGGIQDATEPRDKMPPNADPDGWDFPEGTFPEPGAVPPNPPSATNRPDTDVFPNAEYLPKSPNRVPSGGHRRKGSMSRRRSGEHELGLGSSQKSDSGNFKLRFGLRGHLDTVRTVIFSGGGSPGEPEICTAGDDGMIKRFHIPRLDHPGPFAGAASDLDVIANFTHRGHSGSVLSLTSWSPAPNFSTGGRAQGDGWIFSGGQDATIRVWERGRVDPKATLEGHTDAVWALCVLPTTLGAIFGTSSPYGNADRILLVSGAADGSVRIWSVSAPPQLSSPQPGSNRGMTGRGGRVRGNSMSSGSGFSNSPQASVASNSPFHYTLVHVVSRGDGSKGSPTCIAPLGTSGETFVVSYSDAAVIVYDTKSGEQVGSMDSMETYDGSVKTGVNAIVATTIGLDQGNQHHGSSLGGEEENAAGGPTGGRSMAGSGVEGTIISGHEDRFVRFFDANSGTYMRLPSAEMRGSSTKLTLALRTMYVQHAGSSRRHLQPVTEPRRPRARKRRPRRVAAVLESGEEVMYTRDYEPQSDARRGHLLMCLESGRAVGGQRWRRRSSQGICAIVKGFLLSFYIKGKGWHERGPLFFLFFLFDFVSIGIVDGVPVSIAPLGGPCTTFDTRQL